MPIWQLQVIVECSTTPKGSSRTYSFRVSLRYSHSLGMMEALERRRLDTLWRQLCRKISVASKRIAASLELGTARIGLYVNSE